MDCMNRKRTISRWFSLSMVETVLISKAFNTGGKCGHAGVLKA
jgi:hypothetical protein